MARRMLINRDGAVLFTEAGAFRLSFIMVSLTGSSSDQNRHPIGETGIKHVQNYRGI